MFPEKFLQKENFLFFFNPFALQVHEALYKLLPEHCSRAGIIGILGNAETYQFAGGAGAEPAAVPVVGWHIPVPQSCQGAASFWMQSCTRAHSVLPPVLQRRHPWGVPKLQDKNSSFLLARILQRHVHTLSAEHVSSSTDLHGAIHMLEPRHIWEQERGGHWVLCLLALHTTPGDPTLKRECSRMALSYTAIFISISRGLAETCYELS